jgi:hypothetical protein
MKPTTKEQVSVTLLVDLEYKTQEGRDWLIQEMQKDLPIFRKLRGRYWVAGESSLVGVTGSVTVSSKDESEIRAWRVQNNDRPPVIVRTVSEEKAKWALLSQYRTDPGPVTVVRAPEFDWNSNLLPGDVYSLEHAEAGNKKPGSPKPEWHNPQNVTQEQLGEGYRFLVPWEVDGRYGNKVTWWTGGRWKGGADGDALGVTYRVPASTPIPPKP